MPPLTEFAIEALGDRGHLVLLALSGSHAYGTNRPDSDHDARGVFMLPPESFWRLDTPNYTVDRKEPDVTVHELRKFASLAAAANPNLLEALYSPTLYSTPEGDALIRWRSLFLSRRVRVTYGGYAVSQLRHAQNGSGGSRGVAHLKREKFILHLYRLMLQGIDLLKTGTLTVQVEDPEALWEKARQPLDRVERDFARMMDLMDRATNLSPLPERADLPAINALLVDLYRARLT